MPDDRVRRFIDALHRLEEERDAEPIAEMFADDATLSNPVHEVGEHGPGGAQEFWRTYRDTFGEIHSEFRNVVESDGAAALEWRSHGTTTGGRECHYGGVSILEYDDEGIHSFRAYFDPEELGLQIGVAGRRSRTGSRRRRPASDAPTG